jgi:D-glycero-D-manno-heptose 1,7-bisphosphate phosphatase
MVLEAAAEFEIDLAASFLVGDKASDIECGRRAGTRTILVRTGYGAATERSPGVFLPDYVANDVPEAIRWLLAAIA